jgi:hypothetical protein
VDLSSPQIQAGRGGDNLALKFPASRWDVARKGPEEILLTPPSLNGDMNIMVTVRKVGTGTTAPAW